MKELDDRIAALRLAVLDFKIGDDDPLELEDAMSRLSEDTWSAGWAYGCEFTFWDWIMNDYLKEPHDALPLLELALMAQRYGGWYFWGDYASHPAGDYRARFVPFSEWVPMYEAWKSQRKDENLP